MHSLGVTTPTDTTAMRFCVYPEALTVPDLAPGAIDDHHLSLHNLIAAA